MKKIILTFLFLLIAAGVSAQEKYDLKTRYPEGTYILTWTMDKNMTMRVGIGEDSTVIPVKMTETREMKIVAGPVEADGTRKVTMEYTRVTIDGKVGRTVVKYDSDATPEANSSDTENDMYYDSMLLVGIKLTQTYDKDGKVTQTEGLDESWEEAMEKADPAVKRAMADRKDSIFEMFSKMPSMEKEIQPPTPVAVGDSWPSEMEYESTSMIGLTRFQLKNTLESVETEDGVEIAAIRSIGTFASRDGKMKIARQTRSTTMDSDVDTLTRIEVKTGLPASFINQTKTTMIIERVPGDPVGRITSEETTEIRQTVIRQ